MIKEWGLGPNLTKLYTLLSDQPSTVCSGALLLFLCFVVTLSGVQGLLLALLSDITLGGTQRTLLIG